MPENLHGGTKAEELQTAIDALDDMISALEEQENVDVAFPAMMG